MSFKSIGQVAAYKAVGKLGMEELAARQTGLTPSGGVLFARKPDGDEKIAARQKIVDLFTTENWAGRLNMLTLPGLHWRFERMVLGAREPGWMKRKHPERTHFTGFENDRSIYFAAVTQMPGTETPGRLIKSAKRDRIPFTEMAVKTRHVSFMFANVDDALAHDWPPQPYRDIPGGWDAAWLDYTGQLSVERLAVIARFYQLYIRSTLIITALKARWDRRTSAAIDKAGGHSQWVRQCLPGEVLHDFEYFDTSPMAQVAIRKNGATNA